MIWVRVVLVSLLLTFPAMAQQSSSFKLAEHTFNAGGVPSDGVVLASTNFRVTLATVGESIAALRLSSTNIVLDASFASAYSPPGEVRQLRFNDPIRLVWDPEGSSGDYNLYRDLLSNLVGLGYGNCLQLDIAGETTVDLAQPPSGDGYFYVVTAQNRLEEEGTKGVDSAGVERPNPTPCP
ncbi:MAG: hypothetical protein GY722_12800 [bacterium]|nr:hypothetical protein [bacterium]